MTDPMTRIADALELMALDTAHDYTRDFRYDLEGDRVTALAINALRERIEARHSAPVQPPTDALCSFGCGRVATETANGEPACGDGDACIEMDREPTQQTPGDDDPEWRDVPVVWARWSTIRKGDRFFTARGYGRWIVASETFAGIHHDDGTHLEMVWIKRKPAPQTVDACPCCGLAGQWRADRGPFGVCARCGHGPRCPRPAAEPSAKAKCPTCRCMIIPGTECACCESTSGDDPQLPSLDLDDAEPSASGEGIARLRHTLLEIGAHSWAVGELHDQPWLMASRIVSAINAAHVNATRELRERCERAEKRDASLVKRNADCTMQIDALLREIKQFRADRDEARAEFNAVADERDRAKLERDAAVKRAEAAERERDAEHTTLVETLALLQASADECKVREGELDRTVKRAEAAERVVEAMRDEHGKSVLFSARTLMALGDYDAARKDGAR